VFLPAETHCSRVDARLLLLIAAVWCCCQVPRRAVVNVQVQSEAGLRLPSTQCSSWIKEACWPSNWHSQPTQSDDGCDTCLPAMPTAAEGHSDGWLCLLMLLAGVQL
jgi:hypothetical protein